MDNNKIIKKFDGANMDIDLITKGDIGWSQDECPWNKVDGSNSHKCAVKDVSICSYFCGIKYLDNVLCCYPSKNPNKDNE
mgnify:CR=1 FL=1